MQSRTAQHVQGLTDLHSRNEEISFLLGEYQRLVLTSKRESTELARNFPSLREDGRMRKRALGGIVQYDAGDPKKRYEKPSVSITNCPLQPVD